MATDEWKRDNPKVSGHIPKPLKAQLDQFIKDEGLKGTSEALRIILEKHLSQSEFSNSFQPLDQSFQLAFNSIQERLDSVETQMKEHSDIIRRFKSSSKSQEKSPKVLNSVDNLKPKSSQPVTNRSQLTIFDGWLTTGEAYTELQRRGYKKSQGTFRRTLRQGKISQELVNLGLFADFEVRNQANPKDNSVRWLKIGGNSSD